MADSFEISQNLAMELISVAQSDLHARIAELEAENARLRAALREIAEHADLYGPPDQGDAIALIHVARRALENQ